MTDRDPIRLADAGSDAPEELRALFGAGTRDLPNDAELARFSAKLGPLLAPPGGVGSPSPAATGSAAGLGKLAVVAVALLGGAVLVSRLNREVPSSVPEGRPLPVETAVPKSADAPQPEPSVTQAPAVAESSAPPSSADRPAPRVEQRSPAELEADLLERARSALASNPSRALSLTTEHKLRFPGGILAQEREVIAIEALKRLGKSDQASLRADEFAKHYPGSAHRHKLDAGVTP